MVRQVGYLQRLCRDARSTKHKIQLQICPCLFRESSILSNMSSYPVILQSCLGQIIGTLLYLLQDDE